MEEVEEEDSEKEINPESEDKDEKIIARVVEGNDAEADEKRDGLIIIAGCVTGAIIVILLVMVLIVFIIR